MVYIQEKPPLPPPYIDNTYVQWPFILKATVSVMGMWMRVCLCVAALISRLKTMWRAPKTFSFLREERDAE